MRVGGLALLMLLGLATPMAALAAEVTVDLQPPVITVGDRVEALVRARFDQRPDGIPQLPSPLASWGPVEILSVLPVESAEPEVFQWRLELTAFPTGELALPPLPILVGDDPVAAIEEGTILTVRSVLPEGEEAEPMPPAPPRTLPGKDGFGWTTAILSALCLAAIILLAYRSRPLAAAAVKSPLEELEVALGRLADCTAEEAHTGVSSALRTYLQGALGLPAPERTTTEIRGLLRQDHVDLPERAGLLALLSECDEVKFTGRAALQQEADRRIAFARQVGAAIESHLSRQLTTEEAA